MIKDKIKKFSIMIGILILLSASLYLIKFFTFMFVERTNFSDSMASAVGMLLMTAVVLIISRIRKYKLSVFPKKFSVLYIIFTCVAGVLLILTPSNFSGDIKAIFLLIYSSIVTPLFEEMVFRGYVWNKLNEIFEKEWITYIVSSILFGVWHFGYIGTVAFRTSGNLMNIMLWKVIIGLCYGLVLGLVRLKSKNCYSTMLLHGIMNIFGR